MKNRILIIALIGVFLAGFFGCELPTDGVSISEQIEGFMTDLNNDNYSNLYTHLHPSLTENYQNAADTIFWDAPGMFPMEESYDLTGLTIVGTSATGLITSLSYLGSTITFSMALDGDDYKIVSIKIDSSTKVDSRIPLLR